MNKRGSTLLEFAIAVAVLTPVLVGLVQFTYSFYVIHELDAAVRRGAEFASALEYDSPSPEPSSGWLWQVENVVVYGNPEGAGQTLVAGLMRDHVRVRVDFARGRPHKVAVGITGLELPSPGHTLRLDGKPESSFPYRGR